MAEMDAATLLKIARSGARPSTYDYIEAIFTDFIEFHGDRHYRDDKAIVGGIARLGKMPVTVIGTQKGRNTKENIDRNFGQPHPEGYRKAFRLMAQAEKFKRPVICFINTAGAYAGVGAEERGQGEAIANNLAGMSALTVPIIAVMAGEGGSGGALALAVADRVWMLEHALYSVLSPEGFASIIWKDSARALEAVGLMKMRAQDLYNLGIIEKIIAEPVGGAQNDFEQLAQRIKQMLLAEIPPLLELSAKELVQNRYNRYRKIGVFSE